MGSRRRRSANPFCFRALSLILCEGAPWQMMVVSWTSVRPWRAAHMHLVMSESSRSHVTPPSALLCACKQRGQGRIRAEIRAEKRGGDEGSEERRGSTETRKGEGRQRRGKERFDRDKERRESTETSLVGLVPAFALFRPICALFRVPAPHPLPHPLPDPLPHPLPDPLLDPLLDPLPDTLPHPLPDPWPHPVPHPLPHLCPTSCPTLCFKPYLDGAVGLAETVDPQTDGEEPQAVLRVRVQAVHGAGVQVDRRLELGVRRPKVARHIVLFRARDEVGLLRRHESNEVGRNSISVSKVFTPHTRPRARPTFVCDRTVPGW